MEAPENNKKKILIVVGDDINDKLIAEIIAEHPDCEIITSNKTLPKIDTKVLTLINPKTMTYIPKIPKNKPKYPNPYSKKRR